MAKKLISFLTDRTGWRFSVKAALAALALFAITRLGFGIFSAALFFTVFLGIYLTLPAERKNLRISFWLLIVLAALALAVANPASPTALIGIIFIFTVLFLVILGLVNFLFKERHLVYGILNTLLLLAVFVFIFYLTGPKNFWLAALILFFATVIIFAEVFRFFDITFGRRGLVLSGAVGLLAVELAWLVSYLPLGYLNAAVLLTLILLLGRDSVIANFRGVLNLPFVLRELTFFVFIAVIVFAASNWSL